jgi:hypothetical protein
MMGASKAAGGLDNLHGYTKQGVACEQGAMCGSVGIYIPEDFFYLIIFIKMDNFV